MIDTEFVTKMLKRTQESEFYNGFADYLEFRVGGVSERLFTFTELQESDILYQRIIFKFKNGHNYELPVYLNTFFTKFTVTDYLSFKQYGYDDPVVIEPIKSSITKFALDLEQAIKNHPIFIK